MEILRLHIHILEENKFDSENHTINMVMFDGTCEGKYFNGEILQGGVDTQIYEKSGEGILSARYMLSGTDNEGKTCHLFIDNTGKTGKTETQTTPKIYTDSECLQWLETAKLHGRVYMENEELVISIFCEE